MKDDFCDYCTGKKKKYKEQCKSCDALTGDCFEGIPMVTYALECFNCKKGDECHMFQGMLNDKDSCIENGRYEPK